MAVYMYTHIIHKNKTRKKSWDNDACLLHKIQRFTQKQEYKNIVDLKLQYRKTRFIKIAPSFSFIAAHTTTDKQMTSMTAVKLQEHTC